MHFPCALGWGAVVVGSGLCTYTPKVPSDGESS